MKACFFKLTPGAFVCLISVTVGFTGWAESVKAKELYIQPSINIQTEYDSNKRLKTDGSTPGIDPSSYGLISKVGAKIGARSDDYEVALNNQFIDNRYISDLDLNSENFKLDLSSNYAFNERSQFELNGNYTYDTTLTSALTGTGSGIVQNNLRRKLWTITPTWNYTLSDTQTIQASYTHTDVQYAKSNIGSFSNYTVDNVSASFQQQWTPRLSNFLSLTGMSFKVPATGNGLIKTSRDITQYSISLGMNYQILPTWSASFSGGSRFNNTKQTLRIENTAFEQTTSTDVQGLIFSVTVDKTFEAGNANISFSRSTNPQGQGQLQVRDNLVASINHKFSQRLQLSVRGSLNDISISGNSQSSRARTYYNISPSIRWLVDKQASLTLGYRYRAQSFKRNNNSAVSNSVSLNFNYQWDKLITQRY